MREQVSRIEAKFFFSTLSEASRARLKEFWEAEETRSIVYGAFVELQENLNKKLKDEKFREFVETVITIKFYDSNAKESFKFGFVQSMYTLQTVLNERDSNKIILEIITEDGLKNDLRRIVNEMNERIIAYFIFEQYSDSNPDEALKELFK